MNTGDAINELPPDHILLSRASNRLLKKINNYLVDENVTSGHRLSIVHEIESILDREYEEMRT